ncbi:MAG: EAL domain-containing protein [Magnetovibrio sp.]|nr:EAL domain-containing protein [Magnetovibrio sp.]
MPIGAWVLKQACADILAINLGFGKYLKVAVNISPKQFNQHNFLESIQTIVAESECDPTFLEIEITESLVMEDVDNATLTMKAIRDIGITLSMDDFGTGYSSLAYLRKFPLDALKIDKSFVEAMTESSADASIVSAICSIGRNLRLAVIAEGVENEFEVPMLEEMGCTMIQGYLYGKPMPIDEFREIFSPNNIIVSELKRTWTRSQSGGAGLNVWFN